MNTALKSRMFAFALALAGAGTLTLAQSIAAPTPAQAGVLGSIKGAAKSVGTAAKSLGGAVTHPSRIVSAAKAGAKVIVPSGKELAAVAKNTGVVGPLKTAAKAVGGAAKTVGVGVGVAGKRIGVGFAQTAKQVANSSPGRAVANVTTRIVHKFH
jgi:hypothetical protein